MLDLDGDPEDWFSHNEAHKLVILQICPNDTCMYIAFQRMANEGSATNLSRSNTRKTSRLGEIFQLSLCRKSYEKCVEHLNTQINKSTSDSAKAKLYSKLNLLHELKLKGNISLQECYEEYLGMIPINYHPNYTLRKDAVNAFVDSLLLENQGLPVLIVNFTNRNREIVLFDSVANVSIDNQETLISHLGVLDKIISKQQTNLKEQFHRINTLAEFLPELVQLADSTRERGVILTILSLIFSSTSLRLYIGFSENVINSFSSRTFQLLETMRTEKAQFHENGVDYLNNLIEQNTSLLKKEEEELKIKEKRLHSSRMEEHRFSIEQRKERVKKLQLKRKAFVSKFAKRKLKKWKGSILRQYEKGLGSTRIDRQAEQAVYESLQEHLAAHDRRKGTGAETGYLQGKVTCSQLRAIANAWLKKEGKSLIKSKETVRSWGKPKNKRSIQAKQHRGKNLWIRQKAAKKYADAHVNRHYNMAHVKYYTRLIFSKATRNRYQKYTVRRAMDDKAYLRCGTSEGFSRAPNKPLLLTEAKEAAQLPAYDFPDKVGYVTRGVILLINDMEETKDHNGKDVSVSVTCKPKYNYGSTSTNWANDMYATRMKFPEEHEVKDTDLPENEIQRDVLNSCIFLHDTLLQFSLMSVPDDYLRIFNGEEHLEREVLRLNILIQRGLCEYSKLKRCECLLGIAADIMEIIEMCQTLENILRKKMLDEINCGSEYNTLLEKISVVCKEMKCLIPKHRPIDIQTTDAGPGVGTSEKLVRVRMAEMFQLFDLDLQARMHYAPRDSKTHIVESVMSRLNDAAGDGTYIPVEKKTLMEELGPNKLAKLEKETMLAKQEKLNKEAADLCAKRVSEKYEGVPCMGTTIHSTFPAENAPYHCFFFDESYAKQCTQASSVKKLDSLPGSAYYKKIQNFINTHYHIYDNGIEGIRLDDNFRCGEQLARVQAPVPFINENGDLHYKYADEISTEQERDIDDFNPIMRLRKLVQDCGKLNIVTEETDVCTTVSDHNAVWSKIEAGLSDFVKNIAGKDLEVVVRKEAESLYMQLLRREIQKDKKLKDKLEEKHLYAVMKGDLKMSIKRKSIPPPLPLGRNLD